MIYTNYYEYIQSVDWIVRTLNIRLRNDGICECCNMRYGDEVHHRTYVRLFQEEDADLIHLCIQCHRHVHRIHDCYVWPSREPFLQQLREEADGLKTNTNVEGTASNSTHDTPF